VRAVQAALSDVAGETELHIASSEHSGHNTLGVFAHDLPRLRTERVSAWTLDDFAAEAGLTRLDFLKLDVEGAERRVLEGSRRVLRQMRPVILFEASDTALTSQGSSVPDLLEFLRSQDYRICAFSDRTGAPVPTNGDACSDNLIAIPMKKSPVEVPESVNF